MTVKHKKILILRYRFIGDTILTVPFLRNLRYAEPDAFIAWVVAPGSSEVVAGIPYVDELIYWDPLTIHADTRGTHRSLSAKLAYIMKLRDTGYDKVYVLKRSFSSAIMAFLSGAGERVGFNTEGRGLLLTKSIPYSHDRHEMQSFLDVLRADGVPIVDDYLESWESPEEGAEAEELLSGAGVSAHDRLLVVHPFASMSGKSWAMENYAALAKRMVTVGFRPVIVGAPADNEVLERYLHLFPAEALNFVGRCKLRVTMAILRRSHLYVGNDSGVMHLAAAVGLPLVALFGPTSPQRFGPWGDKVKVLYSRFHCSPCRNKFFTECEPSDRGRPECLETISVDEVFSELIAVASDFKQVSAK